MREKLIRILQDHKTGELFLNPGKLKHGRSIYVCKTKTCQEALKSNKRYKGKPQYQEIFQKINND